MDLGVVLDAGWVGDVSLFFCADCLGYWRIWACGLTERGYSALFIALLKIRSKLVLDFVLTLHFWHLAITSFYTGSFPRNLLWWGLQSCSAAVITFMGIWACQWRELQPISFGGRAKGAGREDGDGGGDLERGDMGGYFGGGEGLGQYAAGEYEMVAMRESGDIV